MKTFLKACVLAFLSMTIGGPAANIAFGSEEDFGYKPQFISDQVCPGGAPSEAQFFKIVAAKYTVRTFTASGQAKARVTYNLAASKNGTATLPEGARFYYALVSPMTEGVVIMLDGCVVPGSSVTIDTATFANFTHRAGITEDEMILAPIGPEM